MQKSNATKMFRYKKIFCYLKENFEFHTILSYGCSDGSECLTLQYYFPNSKIFGTDIIIKSNYSKDNIIYFRVNNFPDVKFDLITINAVLCNFGEKGDSGWGWDLNTVTIASFKDFDLYLSLVDKYLNINGIILLTNSNYLFKDASIFYLIQI